jgi:hypothetical protein
MTPARKHYQKRFRAAFEKRRRSRAMRVSPLPSAQELRELIELKAELDRMYGQMAATSISGAAQQH